MFATISMTTEEIREYIAKTPCNYYDHIDKTQAEWQSWLENSEVNNYTKVAQDLYINNCTHCYFIKQYAAGTVYTWTISRLK